MEAATVLTPKGVRGVVGERTTVVETLGDADLGFDVVHNNILSDKPRKVNRFLVKKR
jgi:hypothetical protein